MCVLATSAASTSSVEKRKNSPRKVSKIYLLALCMYMCKEGVLYRLLCYQQNKKIATQRRIRTVQKFIVQTQKISTYKCIFKAANIKCHTRTKVPLQCLLTASPLPFKSNLSSCSYCYLIQLLDQAQFTWRRPISKGQSGKKMRF